MSQATERRGNCDGPPASSREALSFFAASLFAQWMSPFGDTALTPTTRKISLQHLHRFLNSANSASSASSACSNLRLLWPAPGTGGYPHDRCAAFRCSPKKSVMPLSCLELSHLFRRRIDSRLNWCRCLFWRCGARSTFPVHLSLLPSTPTQETSASAVLANQVRSFFVAPGGRGPVRFPG